MTSDGERLRHYAESNSADAGAELVARRGEHGKPLPPAILPFDKIFLEAIS